MIKTACLQVYLENFLGLLFFWWSNPEGLSCSKLLRKCRPSPLPTPWFSLLSPSSSFPHLPLLSWRLVLLYRYVILENCKAGGGVSTINIQNCFIHMVLVNMEHPSEHGIEIVENRLLTYVRCMTPENGLDCCPSFQV